MKRRTECPTLSIEVVRKPLHKEIVTMSRAINTEANYAILCEFEISHVSIDKTKHCASLILNPNRIGFTQTRLQNY